MDVAGSSTDDQLTVEQIQKNLQRFGTYDYVVFVGMLVGCAAIGVYYASRGKKTNPDNTAVEYLMGGRNMSIFPITMSLIATCVSGITMLGLPSETYTYGWDFVFAGSGFILAGVIARTLFFPILHDLKISSVYEYLERRFDRKVRVFGSLLFVLAQICWLPVVIYGSALAFNQVTGVNIHIITCCVCFVCVFYTTVGGFKGVLWTDVLQTFILVGAILFVVIRGTVNVGGFGVVWERCRGTGRVEFPSLQFDPSIRHTIWSLTLGATASWLQISVLSQNTVQRYLALNSVRDMGWALFFCITGVILINVLCGYTGLLVYATYHDCDPLTTRVAKSKDQLLAFMVMQTLGDLPGVPGLFISGIFSAGLSTLSTGLHSLATVVLEDFVKPFTSHDLSNRATGLIMRITIVVFGLVYVGLVFVVENLGSVLQVALSLGAIAGGPTLGLFFLGVCMPWINNKGAFYGGLLGLGFTAFVIFGAQKAQTSGQLKFPTKPTSVSGCEYIYTYNVTVSRNITAVASNDEVFPLFKMSYLWFSLFGASVTFILAFLISAATGFNNLDNVDATVVSPFVRRFLRRGRSEQSQHEEEELVEMLKKGNVHAQVKPEQTK